MAFRTFLMHPTLFSVETMQNDIWVMLQKNLLSIQALCATIPDFPRVQDMCSTELKPVLQLSEQLAVHRPGPDDVSERL